MNAIIGVPINRKGSYLIDKFISNQISIKNSTVINTKLVFACENKDFISELNSKLSNTNLDYTIISFDVKAPVWARDRIWAITQAREEIRKYSIKLNVDQLVFLDCDMLYSKNIINELTRENSIGYDIVYNAYLLKNNTITFNGFGGTLIAKKVFSTITFRCYESKNKYRVIDEGFFFEMDAINKNSKIYREILIDSCHYLDTENFLKIKPREKTSFEKVRFSFFFRKLFALFSDKPKILIIISNMGYYLMKYHK
jgi:hypothetical protein